MWFPNLCYKVKRVGISSCMSKNQTIWPRILNYVCKHQPCYKREDLKQESIKLKIRLARFTEHNPHPIEEYL